MNKKSQHEELTRTLLEELRRGITPEKEMSHFLESTFSITMPEELRLVFDNEEHPDRDMLFELLFFPDRQTKLKLEPLFTECRCTSEDEKALLDAVCGETVIVDITLEDATEPVSVTLPRECMELFVKRLNVKANPPQSVVDAARAHLAGGRDDLFLVLLRGEKMRWTDETTGFLNRLLKGLSNRGADLETHLVTAIITMSSFNGGHSLQDHFMAIRQDMEAAAEKAHQFEEGLKTLTMETMMMQGMIGPSHTEKEMRHKIRVLDTLIMEGFGVDPTLLEPVRVDLGDFSGGDGVTGMFKAMT
ncbi:hypothetical protein [Desulfoluna spongiiphila]|uniref:Uncharacterized protein n=1 Tax=Desulfoluna spongiiphila TaxID=419481 RepID=A0A1G5C430_9BACT|nr:hypothetical protein [Desulfoluna spongiiphila]SCX97121.1 hypothetical protein SAMN05216233_102365 [Desulfoluna spongiiphila]VVS94101.1 hypothetical protein DBB_36730 [Desulfoluna spongiiphila]